MSYFMAYVVSEEGEPVDGPDLASITGWFDWGTWVLDHHGEYPELAHLAQEGWNENQPGSEALDAMEHECERMMHAVGDPNLAASTAQVLAALRARPEATTGVIATDGEEGGEDEES